ncbi:MAG: hypothetical protein ACR2KX_06450 [Chitinophagaceae bacterium]
MKTQMKHKTTSGMVKAMREIRDKISNEIKDMTFEEERAYLDKLLKSRPVRPVHNKII